MTRRGWIALVATLAASAATAPAAQGAGATYTVLKCHVNSRSANEAVAEVRGPYSTANRCSGVDQRLEVTNYGFATSSQTAYWRFNAPAGTAIVGLKVRANLRRDNHHLAQIVVLNPAGTPRVLANGLDTGQGFQDHLFTGLNDAALVLHLVCNDVGGCPSSEQAHAYAQNIELVLADRSDPQVTSVSGSLVGGGWLRGERRLETQASDAGSGLVEMSSRVNGSETGETSPGCTGLLGGPFTSALAPCVTNPAIGALDVVLETDRAPFVNGPNSVQACADDFAGNGPRCSTRTVYVDNVAPSLAFSNGQSASDPESITASLVEAHSGVASAAITYRRLDTGPWQPLHTQIRPGELTARVDSSVLPAGRYEFRAEATDVAGNVGETTRRADGTPMILSFPLREAVALDGGVGPGSSERQTVSYGVGSEASGRLLDAGGEALGGREVTVEEYFGDGALIDRRTRTVTTDERGRWSSVLPPGPSRTVIVGYAGSSRYQAGEATVGRLNVRSRASFRISRSRVREGGRVVFAGKVGSYAARMPSAGKLVELQVQESANRWNTVREAFHTKPDGRYRLGYRFGRFYRSDARFRFRVKVAREQGWPYKAPVRSRPRTVTVLAR